MTGQVIRAVDSQLPPGDIAELRRLTPSDPFSPAFFKLMASAVDPDRELPSGGNSRDEIERRWAVFMQAAAVMRKLNSRKVGLGSALASAGYSEIRFVRLLKARGSILFREIRTAAHYLASKAQMCDLVDIARLLMVTDAERAESVRRSIARGYYGQSDSPGKEN
ncbi:MAG: hypothetical protein AVO35_11535 [Candidatus Aegiribacteria sp. MLS_C]|nr:MAG: hypothetical protein AVO35_11535 [Candidatus Aegiribacteria sp. MLS_C]